MNRPTPRRRTLGTRALAVVGVVLGLALVTGGIAWSHEPDTYGSWMQLPREQWPNIALVNRIEYTDGQHPVAGCGFLLEVDDEVRFTESRGDEGPQASAVLPIGKHHIVG